MIVIIKSICIMSLLDLYYTLQFIRYDPSLEANPLMAKLWIISPILFVLFKLLATLVFYVVASKFKNRKILKRTIWVPFILYVLVLGIHLY